MVVGTSVKVQPCGWRPVVVVFVWQWKDESVCVCVCQLCICVYRVVFQKFHLNVQLYCTSFMTTDFVQQCFRNHFLTYNMSTFLISLTILIAILTFHSNMLTDFPNIQCVEFQLTIVENPTFHFYRFSFISSIDMFYFALFCLFAYLPSFVFTLVSYTCLWAPTAHTCRRSSWKKSLYSRVFPVVGVESVYIPPSHILPQRRDWVCCCFDLTISI